MSDERADLSPEEYEDLRRWLFDEIDRDAPDGEYMAQFRERIMDDRVSEIFPEFAAIGRVMNEVAVAWSESNDVDMDPPETSDLAEELAGHIALSPRALRYKARGVVDTLDASDDVGPDQRVQMALCVVAMQQGGLEAGRRASIRGWRDGE